MSPPTVTLQRSKDMPRQQGLLLRGSRWFSNFKVPKELQAALGKEHVREALKTSDAREAARRIGYERARWNGIFDNERKKLVSLNPPAMPKTKRLLTAISDQEAFEYATRYLVSSERDFRDWMNREGRLLGDGEQHEVRTGIVDDLNALATGHEY